MLWSHWRAIGLISDAKLFTHFQVGFIMVPLARTGGIPKSLTVLAKAGQCASLRRSWFDHPPICLNCLKRSVKNRNGTRNRRLERLNFKPTCLSFNPDRALEALWIQVETIVWFVDVLLDMLPDSLVALIKQILFSAPSFPVSSLTRFSYAYTCHQATEACSWSMLWIL